MDFEKWLDQNNDAKLYAHFDSKNITIKKVIKEIQDDKNIVTHSFMPFIHTEIVFKKYSHGERKPKKRQIYYSSHYDRCIYQYYSYLLNEKYNAYVNQHGINDVSIAYRNNLDKKNNVDFSKIAFDFIKEQGKCLIFIGDFKDFFDTLDHNYLKKNINALLQTSVLPEDYYKVFKSLTKFSYVDFKDILSFYSLDDSVKNRRMLNRKDKIMSIQKLRENSDLIKTHLEKGIPQGSALSATLSNIYMILFDEKMNNYIKSKNGLYLRYSDDTIFIIPFTEEIDIKKENAAIQGLIKDVPNLVLQSEKTEVYIYDNGKITNENKKVGNNGQSKNIIDYLGFSFDGKYVSVRDKTISKYFYRAYKKADTIAYHNGMINGKKISCKKIYKTYTLKGSKATGKNHGNFLTYIKRASKVYNEEPKVKTVINTHYGKIKKRINKSNKKTVEF